MRRVCGGNEAVPGLSCWFRLKHEELAFNQFHYMCCYAVECIQQGRNLNELESVQSIHPPTCIELCPLCAHRLKLAGLNKTWSAL